MNEKEKFSNIVNFSSNTFFCKNTTKSFIEALQAKMIDDKRKLYDSGCTFNMFKSPNDFDILNLGTREPIVIADGTIIHSEGSGISNTYGKALLVPKLSRGLLSTAQDDKAGKFTLFGDDKVIVLDERPIITGNIIRSGTLVDNQYLSDENSKDISNYVNTDFIYPTDRKIFKSTLGSNISVDKYNYIHCITAHASLDKINKMITNKSLLGLPKNTIRINNVECQACILAKLKRLRSPSNKHTRPQSILDPPKIYRPFEVVGCDVVDVGKDCLSINKNRYVTV